MSTTISVRPDELLSLGGGLTALGGQADDDGALCRSTGRAVDAALGGEEAAGRLHTVAGAWAGLVELLADECRALATTVLAAAESYRDVDASLGRRISMTTRVAR